MLPVDHRSTAAETANSRPCSIGRHRPAPEASRRGVDELTVQRMLYYWPVTVTTALDLDVLERVGTALADRTRRLILLRLLDGPAYPADLALALGASRAGISNHLACLRGCGLVTATREGRQVRYELADQRLAGALRELARVVLDSPACPAHLESRP